MTTYSSLNELLADIRRCQLCTKHLPLGPKPTLRASESAKLLIVGQAPGIKVHQTGIPWNDASGERLQQWLQIDRELFYDESKIAIIPMGFCYPGRGKSGDLPPRPECSPLWLPQLKPWLRNIQLTLLIGQYAQKYYLGKMCGATLAETVASYKNYLPHYFPLPHPSPRNTRWLQKNRWFENDVVSDLRKIIQQIL